MRASFSTSRSSARINCLHIPQLRIVRDENQVPKNCEGRDIALDPGVRATAKGCNIGYARLATGTHTQRTMRGGSEDGYICFWNSARG